MKKIDSLPSIHIRFFPLISKPFNQRTTPKLSSKQDCASSRIFEVDESTSIPETLSPKSHSSRNLSIYNELGFGTVLQNPQESLRQLSKNPSIGVSDFWSSQEKQRFLKEKGLWEVYKEQVKKEEYDGDNYKRIERHSSLPHILDIRTQVKIKGTKRKNMKKNFFQEKKGELTERTNEKVLCLNRLVKKCDTLAKEMCELRNSTKIIENLNKKADRNKVRRKMSRQEINEIQLKIHSLN